MAREKRVNEKRGGVEGVKGGRKEGGREEESRWERDGDRNISTFLHKRNVSLQLHQLAITSF